MKIDRKHSAIGWVILLVICVVTALGFLAVERSILDPTPVKRQLSGVGTYETLRDSVLLDEVMKPFDAAAPNNTLFTRQLLGSVLADAVPNEKAAEVFDPAIDGVYRWLEGDDSQISFTIKTASLTEDFTQAVESRVSQRIATYDVCDDVTISAREALLYDGCLPFYLSQTAATQTITETVMPLIEARLAEDTKRTIEPSTLGNLQYAPDYLLTARYIRAAAVIMFALIVVYFVIRKQSTGPLIVGISITIAALILWLFSLVVAAQPLTFGEYDALGRALQRRLVEELEVLALISGVSGIFSTLLNFPWRRVRGDRG